MPSLKWIAVALAVLAVLSGRQCQSTEETTVIHVVAADLENNTGSSTANKPIVSSSSNDRTKPASSSSGSGWSLLLRKFFDRPSSQQKHADKNRIILEDLALNQANPDSPSNTSAVAFHDEETVAVVHYVGETVESCKLMEVK